MQFEPSATAVSWAPELHSFLYYFFFPLFIFNSLLSSGVGLEKSTGAMEWTGCLALFCIYRGLLKSATIVFLSFVEFWLA